MRFGDETFLFFAKVVLGHDGFVWGILRLPTPEKEVGESELPLELEAAHLFGRLYPTQP